MFDSKIIKAGGITNLTDARYFSAMYVDYIGFNLDPTSEGIDLITLRGMLEWIEGPRVVLEFGHADDTFIQTMLSAITPDAIQLSGFKDATPYIGKGYEVFQEYVIDSQTSIEDMNIWFGQKKDVDSFVLQSDRSLAELNGVLQSFTAKILLDLPNMQTEVSGINKSSYLGIAVKGGEEEKVGWKSFDELDEIFEAIEEL